MDFFQISTRENKDKTLEIYPDFKVGRSKDLMVQGRSFYAIWDEEKGLWSTDEYDVQRLVDAELKKYADTRTSEGLSYTVKYLRSFSNNGWSQFRRFLLNISDNSTQLDQNLTFANTETKKSDFVSRRLPYSLAPGDHKAWDELLGTLYNVEERAKIEWAIGAIVAGDAKKIQKFVVLYGPAGTGKSTVLNIIQKLFEGYVTTFDAKALGSNGSAFATEAFKSNPLVAIQHDGDLSRIEDNTRLNSIISHEDMPMNEKYKPGYTARVNAFLFMGTNQPVKISDAKSGIIRRLIDVHPTGVTIPRAHYDALMSQVDFELGAIAHHCLKVYRSMGKNYYGNYRPLEMMLQTDIFFNFIEANYDIFKAQDGTTVKQAYTLYKEYCADTGIDKTLPQFRFREELRNYFAEFHDRATVNGTAVRSYYSGFTARPFKQTVKDDKTFALVVEETESLLDVELADQPAQYGRLDDFGKEIPAMRWSSVRTTLAEIDTTQLHFVKVPENHIVIDFDLKGDDGGKSLERNLEAASGWPATYAELSKSGSGIHLHYLYSGDTTRLSANFSDGIEVKVFTGDSSLRRRLTRCNNVPIATLSEGSLPEKEKKKVLESTTIQSERGLRKLIERNLQKEIHPGTKSSIDFIHKILEDAYNSGMVYDVSDLKPKVMAFAINSTNQKQQSLQVFQKMKFTSQQVVSPVLVTPKDDRIVLFDVEVYPNLFVICWKYRGSDTVIRMIQPSAQDVETLFSMKLVGFNNRRYDNHILYGAYLGYNNYQLYELSQKLVGNTIGAGFGEAYNLSYADIWDFSSKKQSLKRFEIELGLHHMELDIPWDQPVADEDISRVVEYCVNDVNATEGVLEDRWQDFVARQILADLSGLSVNDSTQKHTAKIIFGNNHDPQSQFVYTDLSKEFPGYSFDYGKSYYRDELVGEGGYIHAEPGMYEDVALLDVASMHPTSIIQLNMFGGFTANFQSLIEARLAIKRRDYDLASTLLDGKLGPYLVDEKGQYNISKAEALSYALKIIINIVYGLTSAKFNNPFRDPRNMDNIAAKRGALFMIDLKHFVQEQGFTVAHIKTDSIKIPNATPEIITAVSEFGKKYGYTFEHEATYDKFCLVNDAVYIARKKNDWVAVGAQFQHPYVFKKLFSKEPLNWDDFCETRQVVQGAMYLDFDAVQKPMHKYRGRIFVGRAGRFVPVTQETGGGLLLRVKDDKSYSVSGTKGHFWMEAEAAAGMCEEPWFEIDESYFQKLVDDAINAIDYYGSFAHFAK